MADTPADSTATTIPTTAPATQSVAPATAPAAEQALIEIDQVRCTLHICSRRAKFVPPGQEPVDDPTFDEQL
jgi:hypothetical protein